VRRRSILRPKCRCSGAGSSCLSSLTSAMFTQQNSFEQLGPLCRPTSGLTANPRHHWVVQRLRRAARSVDSSDQPPSDLRHPNCFVPGSSRSVKTQVEIARHISAFHPGRSRWGKRNLFSPPGSEYHAFGRPGKSSDSRTTMLSPFARSDTWNGVCST